MELLTQSEMYMIWRYEEHERTTFEDEEDYGSDLEGIMDAYDSEDDQSFGIEEDDSFAVV